VKFDARALGATGEAWTSSQRCAIRSIVVPTDQRRANFYLRGKRGRDRRVLIHIQSIPKNCMTAPSTSGSTSVHAGAEAQLRALVVEDDPAVRGLVSRILIRDGFCVTEACNGREAITMLAASSPFQVIILDLAMPVVNGTEVLDYVGRHMPQSLQRIVVVTANARALRGQLPQAVCHLLVKPFDLDAFLDAVRACAKNAGS